MESDIDLNFNPMILYDKYDKVKTISSQEDDEALKRVCKEFESIFLAMMFKEMKKTVPDSGLLESSSARRIFEDMHIDELSKEVSDGEGMGIAEMIYQQFKRGYIGW